MQQKLNQKQFGTKYSTDEQLTGDVWTDGKPVYRKTISFGSLPNNAGKSVAHGIANLGDLIRLDSVGYRPSDGFRPVIPYVATVLSSQISIYVDGTNIVVTTGQNRTDISAYVTLFYTKAGGVIRCLTFLFSLKSRLSYRRVL